MAKVVHILARSLEAANNIAEANKNLYLHTGKWLSSIPEKDGGLRTYSFRVKEV